MIFRKPYAFLIKNFKIIHVILTILTVYLFTKSYNIYAFFNEYVSNKYTISSYISFSENYISILLYLAIICTISILILIIFLFKSKKKPSKFYEVSLIYYLILLVLFIITKNILISFETSVIESEMARIYRDVSLIVLIPQAPIILAFFVRALGFNIKKFDFEKDIKDLNITDTDNEEVELSLNYETYKYTRVIRRFIREFIYYIKENLFMFLCICIISIIAIIILVITGNKNYNDNYKQNQNFIYNNLIINIKDSIITNLDYKGDKIDDNYYLVLQTLIENPTNADIEFKTEDLKLKIGNKSLYPNNDKSVYFLDYGKEFYDNKIKKNSKMVYTIVYTLNEEEIKKSYNISIYKGSINDKKDILATYNIIKVNPVKIVEKSIVSNNKIGDNVIFSDSNVLNTKVLLKSYMITNKYSYDYEVCITKNDCRKFKEHVNVSYQNNEKTLLVLDIDCKIDKKSPFYLTSSRPVSFLEKFGKIVYKDGNADKYSSLINVTPENLKDKYIFEIDKYVENSEDFKFSFIIRNKEYLINLK